MRQMKLHRQIRVQKLQDKNRMVGKTFSTLEDNERRKSPWLGSSWFKDEELTDPEVAKRMHEKREQRYKEWDEETERMLKINPKLKIVD